CPRPNVADVSPASAYDRSIVARQTVHASPPERERPAMYRIQHALSVVLAFTATFAVAADEKKVSPAPVAAAPADALESIALPGAPADGVGLDYIAVDRTLQRVWVPAGG